jgi:DNA-binding CsgD family transcriptional regulator
MGRVPYLSPYLRCPRAGRRTWLIGDLAHNDGVDLTCSVGLHLRADDAENALSLVEAELASGSADAHLAAGLIYFAVADFAVSADHLEAAFLDYKATGRRRRAALAASHLTRLHFDGTGRHAVAAGWLARARRLLVDDPDCAEAGWVALALIGCSVANIDELDENATHALTIAQRLGDADLECKALADSGLALVSRGTIDQGLARIDEAMVMASSGECDNVWIVGQVYCAMVTACGRLGDLHRLEDWLATEPVGEMHAPGTAPPNLLLNHCQIEYGTLLCEAGRWTEAEAALRFAVDATAHFSQRAQSRAALAGLRIDQGRLPEAASLLNGLEQRAEAQLSLVRLHRARGDDDLAVAVGRQALRMMPGDRLRTAPIQAVLLEAELARGNVVGAREAARALEQYATQTSSRTVAALAEWAAGRVTLAEPGGGGRTDEAVAHLDNALHALQGDERSLLAADIQLDLARALTGSDRPRAIAEARRALATYGRVGARRMHSAQALLHELGDASAARPAAPDAVRTLTAREREILNLLAQGLSNPQIAERLVISPKTAEHHVGAILRKLQLSSRSEAAVYAATLTTSF